MRDSVTKAEVRTSIKGEKDLPRYFGAVFDIACKMNHGQLDMVLPDGRVFRAQGSGPGPVAELRIHNNDIFGRLIREGDLGFCEAYLDEWWSTPDLQSFMDLIHADNEDIYDGFLMKGIVRALERFRFWLQSNSKRQAKKNISAHYDLGNEFYKLWLDDTMTYSSALFETGQESTEAAQIAKYKQLVDEMGAQPGDHVLEIGCGWGGFAEYAAKERGLKVTGLTISQEQHDYAVARIAKAGLSDMVEIKMQDYRDERGTYDGIASIEMFEAVGQKYWPVYFQTLKKCLKPGKQATLQIITVQDRRWEIYSSGVDFIQKYIFPGGMLPAPSVLKQEVREAGLEVHRSVEFGESYSITLRRWHETFNEKWDEVAALGFDERFRRMWNFYLTSCAATFHYDNCDVTQITVTNPARRRKACMPTAAKLIGALLLSGVGWLAALAAMQTFPDGMPARAFPPTIAAIGAWQGWVVIGGAAGQGLRAGLGQGLRAAVQMAVIGLAVFALREMFRRSANLRYDGPGDAAVAALDLFVQYGLQSLTVPIWGVVIAGGLMAGALTEWSARHWR